MLYGSMIPLFMQLYINNLLNKILLCRFEVLLLREVTMSQKYEKILKRQ